jgi:hypothetical protein
MEYSLHGVEPEAVTCLEGMKLGWKESVNNKIEQII